MLRSLTDGITRTCRWADRGFWEISFGRQALTSKSVKYILLDLVLCRLQGKKTHILAFSCVYFWRIYSMEGLSSINQLYFGARARRALWTASSCRSKTREEKCQWGRREVYVTTKARALTLVMATINKPCALTGRVNPSTFIMRIFYWMFFSIFI